MNQILSTSITILLCKRLYKWYKYIAQGRINIYYNSHSYRLLKGFWEKIKICFRYSFLGKITAIEQEKAFVSLTHSRTVQYLINFYQRWIDKIINYSRASLTTESAKYTKEEFRLSPMKITSTIVVTAIIVNVALSIVLQKQIGLWGWLLRGLFLFVGVGGISCGADWPTVKRNSAILKTMLKEN